MRAAGARPDPPGPRCRLLWCTARARRPDLGGAPPRATRDRLDARRHADRRRQCGLRRGHEGLRPATRHTGSHRVLGTGAGLLRVARRATDRSRSVTPAPWRWSRTRAISAMCSTRRGSCARCSAPAYAPARHRRRRPVLRRRRRVRGGATRRSRATSGRARCRPSAARLRRTRDERGSPLVVSANPGCAMHLAAAGLTVRHPAELLADALESPRDPPMEERGA